MSPTRRARLSAPFWFRTFCFARCVLLPALGDLFAALLLFCFALILLPILL